MSLHVIPRDDLQNLIQMKLLSFKQNDGTICIFTVYLQNIVSISSNVLHASLDVIFFPSPLFVLFVHPLHLPDQAHLHILHVLARLSLKNPIHHPPKRIPKSSPNPPGKPSNPSIQNHEKNHQTATTYNLGPPPALGGSEHGGEDPEVFD